MNLLNRISSLAGCFFLALSLSPLKSESDYPSPQINRDPRTCSFTHDDYHVTWAYEPHSRNVVFIIKQQSNNLTNFWTGIGIGSRPQDGNKPVDFIGVFVKNRQIGIADTYIPKAGDALFPDAVTNVQSIAFEIKNDGLVVAKFARALESSDTKHDRSLSGCPVFNFAVRAEPISRTGIVPDFDKFAYRTVCDIDKKCIIDLAPSLPESTTQNGWTGPAVLTSAKRNRLNPWTTRNHEKITGMTKISPQDVGFKKPTTQEPSENSELPETPATVFPLIKDEKPVEFSHSVDISGTGDPCSFTGVNYTVKWQYNEATDKIEFTMKHPIKSGKWWSAVGIGDNMSDMDIAIIFVSSGRPKRIRDYFSSSYTVPTEDKQQDWFLSRQRSSTVDGEVTLGFSRKVDTGDNSADRSLDGCVLFQFAANSGRYGAGFTVQKHDEWPDLYKACDVKTKCKATGSTHVVESQIDADESEIADEAIAVFNEEEETVTESITNENNTETVIATFPPEVAATTNNSNEEQKVVTTAVNATIKTDVHVSQEETAEAKKKGFLITQAVSAESIPTESKPPDSTTEQVASTTEQVTFTTEAVTVKQTTTEGQTTVKPVTPEPPTVDTTITTTTETSTIASESTTWIPVTSETTSETQTTTLTPTTRAIPPHAHKLITKPSTTIQTTPKNLSKTNSQLEIVDNSTNNETDASAVLRDTNSTPRLPENDILTKTETNTTDDSAEIDENDEDKFEGSGESDAENTTTTTSTKATTTTAQLTKDIKLETAVCGLHHEDFSLCAPYFDGYLGRVKQWADDNNERFEAQFDKACHLLKRVKNVRSLCCSIFVKTCKDYIDLA